MARSSFADILQSLSDDRASKVASKLPSLKGIGVPTSLSLEQCSSEAAALYKSEVAASMCTGSCGDASGYAIADLTGGLGVDCWAFGKRFGRVLYNDRDTALADNARINFDRLGVEGVTVRNFEVSALNCQWSESLRQFRPDIVYMDPARRGADGKKVFLPEDCSPNVLELVPILSGIAPRLLLKLSPMADISLIIKRLTQAYISSTSKRCLKEIQVVGLQGECKELLCLIDGTYDGDCRIAAVELHKDGSHSYLPKPTSIHPDTTGDHGISSAAAVPGAILAVPTAVLLKAGFHDAVCQEAGFVKADTFTHLYLGSADNVARLGCKGFLKCYDIIEVAPLNNKNINDFGKRYNSAEVSAKNIRISSDQLRARLGIRKPSGDIHIFGYSTPEGNFLAACR